MDHEAAILPPAVVAMGSTPAPAAVSARADCPRRMPRHRGGEGDAARRGAKLLTQARCDKGSVIHGAVCRGSSCGSRKLTQIGPTDKQNHWETGKSSLFRGAAAYRAGSLDPRFECAGGAGKDHAFRSSGPSEPCFSSAASSFEQSLPPGGGFVLVPPPEVAHQNRDHLPLRHSLGSGGDEF